MTKELKVEEEVKEPDKKSATKRKAKPTINVPTEDQEQMALAQWLDLQRWARGRWFHIPNERWDKVEAAKMKKMGG